MAERRVAEAFAELKLWSDAGIVEAFSLECLMVVSHQAVSKARVSKWKFAAGVKVAKQNVGHCLPAFVAGIVSHQHRVRMVGNAIDDSWPAFGQHQYDRFARGFDRFSEFTLRLTNVQVGNVSGRFRVRSFAETQHHDI